MPRAKGTPCPEHLKPIYRDRMRAFLAANPDARAALIKQGTAGLVAMNKRRAKPQPVTECGEYVRIEVRPGTFVLLDTRDRHFADGGSLCLSNGYITVNIDGKNTHLGRAVLAAPKGLFVDHINMDPLDNRRKNLRFATKAQNMHNRRRPRHNSTGFKGVYFNKATGKWDAYISANKRRTYLGAFLSAEAAARAYDLKAAAIHGEFARPNFPREAA